MQGFLRSYLSLYRPTIQAINRLLQPHGLSYSLWQVVLYLQEHERASLVEISTYYGIEKPSITRRVQRLEELGLLTSESGKDRREKWIALSSRGRSLYARCRQQLTDLEHQITAGVPHGDLEQAVSVFRRVLSKLK